MKLCLCGQRGNLLRIWRISAFQDVVDAPSQIPSMHFFILCPIVMIKNALKLMAGFHFATGLGLASGNEGSEGIP